MEILSRDIGGMPLWLWAIIVGGGGIALAWYLHRKSGGSSGALGQNTAGQAPQLDPSLYDPYTGVPLSIESSVNPATGQPNYYNPPTPTTPTTPTPTPTPGPGGGMVPSAAAHIRNRDQSGQFAYWDKSHPQGVPVRPTPGSSQIAGYLGYGVPVTITGAGLSAQYNNQGQYVQWLPVSGGWIQAVDVIQPAVQPRAAAPAGQSTPFWPQMTDVQQAQAAGGKR